MECHKVEADRQPSHLNREELAELRMYAWATTGWESHVDPGLRGPGRGDAPGDQWESWELDRRIDLHLKDIEAASTILDIIKRTRDAIDEFDLNEDSFRSPQGLGQKLAQAAIVQGWTSIYEGSSAEFGMDSLTRDERDEFRAQRNLNSHYYEVPNANRYGSYPGQRFSFGSLWRNIHSFYPRIENEMRRIWLELVRNSSLKYDKDLLYREMDRIKRENGDANLEGEQQTEARDDAKAQHRDLSHIRDGWETPEEDPYIPSFMRPTRASRARAETVTGRLDR